MSEYSRTEEMRAKGFLGLCAMGVLCGVLEAYLQQKNFFISGVISLMKTLLACWVGGGLGLVLRLLFLNLKGRRVEPQLNIEGILILGAYGAFLGFVAAAVFGSLPSVTWWCMAGTACGGFVTGLLGDMIYFFTKTLLLMSMKEEEREQAHNHYAQEMDEDFKRPKE